MAATIKIKNSSTANAKPTSSDLVQGELAINVTDKKIFTEDSGGNIVELGANFNGFKNRIINGAMMIDQRNAGASVTPTVDNTFTLDRWSTALSVASKFSIQQSSTAATGFTNSLLATSLSAYSVSAGDFFALKHTIEGFNVADLGFGAAGASTVTLSFWVRSSLTGTFGGALQNGAQNRSYPFSFTISSANTFEYKTVTIAGDTTGTWVTNNGKGLSLWINLGSGSTYSGTAGAWAAGTYFAPTGATSVVGTNGATFYITGVQLEKGSTATSFDYRPYGTELALCQRYYEKSFFQTQAVPTNGSQGYAVLGVGSNTYASSQILGHVFYKVVKRTSSPTVTVYSFTSSTTGVASNANSGADLAANSGTVNSINDTGFSVSNASGAAQTTSSQAVIFNWTSSAEL